MKCETINTILTFVLGVFAVLGVVFALQTIFLTREFRALQWQAMSANKSFMEIQALANDALAYNLKYPNPDLTRLLQQAQVKPATR